MDFAYKSRHRCGSKEGGKREGEIAGIDQSVHASVIVCGVEFRGTEAYNAAGRTIFTSIFVLTSF